MDPRRGQEYTEKEAVAMVSWNIYIKNMYLPTYMDVCVCYMYIWNEHLHVYFIFKNHVTREEISNCEIASQTFGEHCGHSSLNFVIQLQITNRVERL